MNWERPVLVAEMGKNN